MQKLLALSILFSLGCSHLNVPKWATNLQPKQEQQFSLKKLWVRSTLASDNLGFRKLNRSSPVLVDDLVVQANALEGVVAYKKTTGSKKWSFPIENGAEVSIAQIKDRLFVAALDGRVYSLEGRTGKLVWSFETKTENVGAPTLENGVLYFISGASVLYALDAATGKQLWVYAHQDTANFSIRGMSQPTIFNGMLYAGFGDGVLVAMDAASGALRWQVQLNKNKRFRDIDAKPIVIDGQIFVPGFDDKLYCLNPKTGELLWKIDQGGYSGVSLFEDKLIYPTSSGEILALKKSDGSLIWKYSLSQGLSTEVKSVQGMVVFGESNGSLVFLDLQTGESQGRFRPGRGITASPTIDTENSRVYFISNEANLYAFEFRRPMAEVK